MRSGSRRGVSGSWCLNWRVGARHDGHALSEKHDGFAAAASMLVGQLPPRLAPPPPPSRVGRLAQQRGGQRRERHAPLLDEDAVLHHARRACVRSGGEARARHGTRAVGCKPRCEVVKTQLFNYTSSLDERARRRKRGVGVRARRAGELRGGGGRRSGGRVSPHPLAAVAAAGDCEVCLFRRELLVQLLPEVGLQQPAPQPGLRATSPHTSEATRRCAIARGAR